MKKLLIIALMALSFTSVAQLTPEQKKDPMRPKGMVQVGSEGEYSFFQPYALTHTVKYYLYIKKMPILVGYRFWAFGSNSYKYYWIPKYCKCSQENIQVNE